MARRQLAEGLLAAQTLFMGLIQRQAITAGTAAAAVTMGETAGRQAAAAAEVIKLEPGRRLVHVLPARDRASANRRSASA